MAKLPLKSLDQNYNLRLRGIIILCHVAQVEQSQADRTRKKFFPIRLTFRGDQPMRVSVGRLHFAETTLNNMRKKGRPNPEQRWVQAVERDLRALQSNQYLLFYLRC